MSHNEFSYFLLLYYQIPGIFQSQLHRGWWDIRGTTHGAMWRGNQLLAHKPVLSSNYKSPSTFHALNIITSETGWLTTLFSLNIFTSCKINNAFLALSINNTLYFHHTFLFLLCSKHILSSSDPREVDTIISLYIPHIT